MHVFTIASGHMYERLQKIMILSVVRNTKCARPCNDCPARLRNMERYSNRAHNYPSVHEFRRWERRSTFPLRLGSKHHAMCSVRRPLTPAPFGMCLAVASAHSSS